MIKQTITAVLITIMAMANYSQAANAQEEHCCSKCKATTVYDFCLTDQEDKVIKLSDYKGKVLLIVNTATGCGFTPQYEHLEDMYKNLRAEGFEIIDIPCNQFGNQAPGTDEEITSFCKLTFGTEFQQFKKSDVNGKDELPLYTWLKSQKAVGEKYSEKAVAVMEKLYNEINEEPRKENDIQWNFTKFLINRKGEVVARFEPMVDMTKVKECVEKELRK